jgi:hypothetical protein
MPVVPLRATLISISANRIAANHTGTRTSRKVSTTIRALRSESR